MKRNTHMALAVAVIGVLLPSTSLSVAAIAGPAESGCAVLGSYSVIANGNGFAASAPPGGIFASVYSGTAAITHYSGCGTSTLVQFSTDGPGSLLRQPVTALLGDQLRSAGDLLVHFSGVARQDPFAPGATQAVVLAGVATYARVTTSGRLHGKVKLSYSVKTLNLSNVRGQLRVATDFGGVFSLSAAIPGPSVYAVASSFPFFFVGAKNPARLKASRSADPNL